MINRKTITWLVAVIWVAIALVLWLAVLGPSNLPVIIAESAQAETGPEAGTSDPEEQGRFTVHNATPENLYRLGEAVMAFTNADLALPTLDVRFHSDRGPCDGYLTATPGLATDITVSSGRHWSRNRSGYAPPTSTPSTNTLRSTSLSARGSPMILGELRITGPFAEGPCSHLRRRDRRARAPSS